MNTSKSPRRRDANVNITPETDDVLQRIKRDRNWDKRFIVERLVEWFDSLPQDQQFQVIYRPSRQERGESAGR